MPLYTLHYYISREAPAGITFVDVEDDAAALAEAERLLAFHDFRCVEVCQGEREVGFRLRSAA